MDSTLAAAAPASKIFDSIPASVYTDDSYDMRGFVFGNLTVVEYIASTELARYNCLCKCGNTVNLTLYSLTAGKRKRVTCGKQCKTPLKQSSLAQFYRAHTDWGLRPQLDERNRLRELRRAGESTVNHCFDFSI